MYGARSSDGCAASIAGSPGRTSGAATAPGAGGQPGTNGRCSTPPRCAPRATATGVRLSRRPGQLPDEDNQRPQNGTWGAPGALRGARRVRETARRNGPAERPEPRSGPISLPETVTVEPSDELIDYVADLGRPAGAIRKRA